eukprot:TRINITY_DN85272_c0_g1_i1.p1 TRINITY_DN85272_c0_g1~~TRINITY_DN85272_c0_g1_i1.p1  ORF type:complete len:501 (+),score=-13.56 TRINITY_DN85272_c0_g1_i1:29-1531(+)
MLLELPREVVMIISDFCTHPTANSLRWCNKFLWDLLGFRTVVISDTAEEKIVGFVHTNKLAALLSYRSETKKRQKRGCCSCLVSNSKVNPTASSKHPIWTKVTNLSLSYHRGPIATLPCTLADLCRTIKAGQLLQFSFTAPQAVPVDILEHLCTRVTRLSLDMFGSGGRVVGALPTPLEKKLPFLVGLSLGTIGEPEGVDLHSVCHPSLETLCLTFSANNPDLASLNIQHMKQLNSFVIRYTSSDWIGPSNGSLGLAAAPWLRKFTCQASDNQNLYWDDPHDGDRKALCYDSPCHLTRLEFVWRSVSANNLGRHLAGSTKLVSFRLSLVMWDVALIITLNNWLQQDAVSLQELALTTLDTTEGWTRVLVNSFSPNGVVETHTSGKELFSHLQLTKSLRVVRLSLPHVLHSTVLVHQFRCWFRKCENLEWFELHLATEFPPAFVKELFASLPRTVRRVDLFPVWDIQRFIRTVEENRVLLPPGCLVNMSRCARNLLPMPYP